MVYTRSSPLVHDLHSKYLSVHLKHSQTSVESPCELIYPRENALTLHKLSAAITKRQLDDILRGFFQAEDKEVLVVSVSMQDTSTKAINHLRILVEEAERHINYRGTKLVAILLHFPSSMFPQGCYPALFLNGWDHHYLDSIAHSMKISTIDTELLFLRCCSSNLPSVNLEKSLLAALQHSLCEAARILASSSSSTFSRRQRFEDFLISKGAGQILCHRFLSYLSPSVLTGYLQEAARLAQVRDSSSNITNSVESMLKGNFVDFLKHVVFILSYDHTLEIILDARCNPATRELFKRMLEIIPLPDYANLSLPVNHLDRTPIKRCCRFPLYRLTSQAIEAALNMCIETINLSLFSDFDGKAQSPVISLSGQDVESVLEHKLRQEMLVRILRLVLLIIDCCV